MKNFSERMYLAMPIPKVTTYNESIGKTFQSLNAESRCPLTMRTLRYGELPTFTKSIIYPDAPQADIHSTTHDTFTRKELPQIHHVKGVTANIIMEGEHDFQTTHRCAFRGLKPSESQARRYRGAAQLSMKDAVMLTQVRASLLQAQSQFQADFPRERAWKAVDPRYRCAPSPVAPLISTLTLSQGHAIDYRTEQKASFIPLPAPTVK
ncbi:hypothetical protein Ciccas_013803 [Cichlidogyrus casuarinus]|uniref:Uncharacterized protein n=1 Tax=Cichlidogyrus casuarinus TaxID=1844966 RepID=A0ABD2PLX2_9PLAT